MSICWCNCMDIDKVCVCCGLAYKVPHWRGASKYCSRECSDKSKIAKKELICFQCGKEFHMKKSQQMRYGRSLGYFCSSTCLAEKKKEAYYGDKNPNYKGRTEDKNGYAIVDIQSPRPFNKNVKRLHQAVCCETIGSEKIPTGYVCHHRDCDRKNNTPINLVLITPSDHRWIHKQFGSATLWAYMNNKVSLHDMILWSNDKSRCEMLLPISVLDQKHLSSSDSERGDGGFGSSGK